MSESLYLCSVVNGILEINNREKMKQDIRTQCPDGQYELILRKRKKRRSSALNRYYWGVIIRDVRNGLYEVGTKLQLKETDEWIKDILGKLDAKTVHEYLKDLYIEKIVIDESTGEIIHNEISTKNMSNIQFMEYYEPVYAWAKSFLGITIPLPNENFEIPEQYKIEDDEQSE